MTDSIGPDQDDDFQRRIETIAEEFLDELQAGGHPDPANMVAAHPELAWPLKRRLALVERLFRSGRNANQYRRGIAAEQAHRLKCPHCGNRIQLVEPRPKEVTCVNCGSSFRVEPDTTATYRPSGVPGRIGRFQVLEVLGRGAFGEVYKARDSELDRFVALKIPRTDSFATPEEAQRFLREARSAAGLRHPSIVQVHEISQEHGSPYIVSDYIEGLTLADLISAGRPAFRESAQLVAQLADAIHYAHRQKIIHRDIKPSNILLGTALKEKGGSGGSTTFTPFLTDFGLARRDEGEITVTLDGQVLGTPAYMSPEQAAGDHAQVDGRSDVYSLGVVLYELISGELPFRGTRRMLLHQVLHDEPRPPRTLNDKIPRDLETICLKAMAKEPARRYGTAAELALDLRRWLNLEPIDARPVSAGERLWRWCRRRPAQAALVLASMVAVLALVGIGVALAFNFRLQAVADEAERQRGIAMVKKTEAEQARAESERQRQEAQRQRAFAVELGLRARRYWYAADIALAWQAWSDGDVARMREFLDRQRPKKGNADLRGFEWHHLWTLCHRERHEVVEGASCLTAVAFSADGGTLATGGLGAVTLRDPASGEARHTFSGLEVWIQGLAFSPDSKTLAAVGGASPAEPGRVYLWDLSTRELKHVSSEHTGFIGGVAFSPDGVVLATEGNDKQVRLWNVATLDARAALDGHEGAVVSLAFHPREMRLVSGGTEGTVRIWDLDDLENPRVLNAAATSLAVSPNGRDLATANSRTAQLWDFDTGVEKASFEIVDGSIHSLAFDPDGDTLAAGVDRGVKAADEIMVWDLASLRPRTAIKGALRQFHSLAFSPDGRTLAGVGGGDEREPGKLVLWDATTWQRPTHLVGNAALVALAPDGNTLISAGAVTSTNLESMTQKLAQGSNPGWDFGKAVLSTFGSAISGSPGRCTVWNLDHGKSRMAFASDAVQVTALAVSVDGRTVACAGPTSGVKVWDVATATEQASIAWPGTLSSLAFSPDGETLALGGLVWGDSIGFALTQGWQASQGRLPGEVQLWNFKEHRKVGVLKGHRELVTALGFSPDGTLLATGSGKIEMTPADDTTGQIKLWDVSRGHELYTLEGHPSAITCVAFSPDGKTLATGSGSLRQSLLAPGEVRLWDLETREARFVIGGFTGGVQCLSFSADGRTLVTGSSGLPGEVKLWQVATAQELLNFKVSVQEVISLSFSSDGRTLAAGTLQGPIVIWHAVASDQELE